MFTDTHCNKRRREETRSEGGCTSCRGKKKKRERRRTKSEVEKKSESEGMCDAIKKKEREERRQIVRGEKYKWRPDGRRSRRYRGGGGWEERKSGMRTETGRKGAGRGGRMREVGRRSNFLTRRLVAA